MRIRFQFSLARNPGAEAAAGEGSQAVLLREQPAQQEPDTGSRVLGHQVNIYSRQLV